MVNLRAGYRPKTEVLYKERLGAVHTRTVVPSNVVREIVVPGVREVVVPRPGPSVVLGKSNQIRSLVIKNN